MTSTTSPRTAGFAHAAPRPGRLPGLMSLVRKEVTEWRRGRRAPVVLIITALIMSALASIAWVTDLIRRSVPPDVTPPSRASLVPLDNMLASISAQLLVLVSIFAVMSILVTERDAGTLAWTASKPVSRTSIWLSKWISATAMLSAVAAIIPLLVVVTLVTVLYGVPPLVPVLIVGLGMIALVAVYAAISLAAATLVPTQAGVAAIAFGAFVLPELIGALIPITPYLPTSILRWAIATAAGQDAGLITPVAWLVGILVLVAFSVRRMERVEL